MFSDRRLPDGITRRFVPGRKIGKGSTCVVLEGRRRTVDADGGSPGDLVALKVLDAAKFQTPRAAAFLRNEIDIMRRLQELNHPHIIKFFGSERNEHWDVLVLEHLDGQDLFCGISRCQKYAEKDASNLMRRVVSAIKACHDAGILHRDLKPENIVYARKDAEDEIRIADFGGALLYQDDHTYNDRFRRRQVGTWAYMAPEVIASCDYTPACDIWSLGVILYVLLAGYLPFYANSEGKLLDQIQRGDYRFHSPYFDNISSSAKDLVRQMLRVNTEERITSEAILRHPFICSPQSEAALVATQSRLRRLNALRKLRSCVLAIMASARLRRRSQLHVEIPRDRSFSEEELQTLQRHFDSLDEAKSGEIGREAFYVAMERLGFADLPLQRLFAVMDKDGNGSIDYKEFLAGLCVLRAGGTTAVRFCFQLYDEDGNGFIDKDELAKALFSVVGDDAGEEGKANRLAQVFERLDTNRDGKISFEEWKAGVHTDPALYEVFLRPMESKLPPVALPAENAADEEPREMDPQRKKRRTAM